MSEAVRLIKRLGELSAKESPASILYKGLDKIGVYLLNPIKKLTYANKSFEFDGRNFNYAAYSYNASWRNERGIEIPILLDFLARFQGQKILEIGNVSRYYGKFSHEVVDKYEHHPDVKNIDIVDYNPPQKNDALVSISTFEHIGWDEEPKDPDKILRAINKCREIVKNPENILISFPLGYNSDLDRLISNDLLPFRKMIFMVRISQDNIWQVTTKEDAMQYKYGQKYLAANAVLFGIGLD